MNAARYDYIEVSKALNMLIEQARLSIDVVELDIESSVGLVAAENVFSPIDLPPFDRSAVDGYAVCSEAISSASPNNPVPLKLISYSDKLPSCDYAVEISTGARMPLGADAVVMLEDAYREGDTVYILRSVPKYGNVSRKGEDIKEGEIVIEKGTIIKPVHVAVLSALGITKVKVFRKVRIGLVSTGSEVMPPQQGIEVYRKGMILDSTAILLRLALSMFRFIEVNWYGFVKDHEEEIKSVAEKALKENDVVILTGGTGPGNTDKTFKAVSSISNDLKVLSRGLAIRPGRPTTILVINGKPVFLLSGFPVAAYIALHEIVLRFVYTALGIKEQPLIEVPVRLSKRVFGSVGYDTYIRAKVTKCDDELCAEPLLLHGSGVLRSLLEANALIVVPRNVEGYEKGERIWAKLL
jgi:molybdopterin molybdotransferase